jgi:hypothetical protein
MTDDLGKALEKEIAGRKLAMTVDEARRLHGLFGRMPTPLEFHLFDIMWSEHCSYKSSRRLLKGLPTRASQVVVGPGRTPVWCASAPTTGWTTIWWWPTRAITTPPRCFQWRGPPRASGDSKGRLLHGRRCDRQP